LNKSRVDNFANRQLKIVNYLYFLTLYLFSKPEAEVHAAMTQICNFIYRFFLNIYRFALRIIRSLGKTIVAFSTFHSGDLVNGWMCTLTIDFQPGRDNSFLLIVTLVKNSG